MGGNTCDQHLDMAKSCAKIDLMHEILNNIDNKIDKFDNKLEGAVKLAQDQIVQNTTDIALMVQRIDEINREREGESEEREKERKILYSLVSHKNRVGAIIGFITFVLLLYGLDIFKIIKFGGT